MSYEQQVWNAWSAGLFLLIVLVTFFVLSHRSEDNGPTLLARMVAAFIMSREQKRAPRNAGMNPVYIPVSGMPYQAGDMETDVADEADIDAENTDMPRLSRNISDSEMVVLLAAQKGTNGKYRYSANQIRALVGGDRNAVLAKVKDIRDVAPPAEYMQPDGTKVQATYPITGRRTPA
jgi:hypothetical protein